MAPERNWTIIQGPRLRSMTGSVLGKRSIPFHQ